MIRKLTIGALLLISAFTLKAQIISVDETNDQNINKFGGSMYEYVAPQVQYSAAPKGFTPFYLSHYGRHGSRFMLETSAYHQPYDILKEAQDKGVLTDFGKTVLDRVEIMMNHAEGRLGDLTEKGQRQHRGITSRMLKNYPEIFRKNANVVARASTSHRVIMSMLSGLNEITRQRPDIKLSYDGSSADSWFINKEDPIISPQKNSPERSRAVNEFNEKHTHPERLMTTLFTDTTYITRYKLTIQPRMFPGMPAGMMIPGMPAAQQQEPQTRITDMSSRLYTLLYDMAANMQSHDLGIDLNDVFTPQEWYDSFTMNNLYWYSVSAFSPLTGNIVPYGHADILRHFVQTADEAIAGNGPDATLRYGHDTALFPLLCLMEVNDCAWNVGDPELIADKWVDYNIVHMGSNIQWVFYRDKQGKVLLKVLLNEEEARLPLDCYVDAKGRSYPAFYEWDKVRKFYQNKLDWWDNYKKSQAR